MDFFTEIGRQCVSIQKIAKFSKTRYMVGSMLDPTIYHCRTPFPYGGFCNPADATSAGELLTQDSPGTNTRAVQEGDTGHCVNLIPRKVFVENTQLINYPALLASGDGRAEADHSLNLSSIQMF